MNKHAFSIWGKSAWMRKSLYFMLCAFLLSGCCKVQYASFVSDKFSPKPVNEIEIYSTSLPDRPYFEIGMFRIQAPHEVSFIKIIKSLQQKASEVGADAIIISDKINILGLGHYVYQATAIRFK
ncbi:MAG: hypothetical protein JRD43_00500 [Deltaproteobacteria bacterium]|nr:hypothetical protein [Deltaproteobacteria bacterium]